MDLKIFRRFHIPRSAFISLVLLLTGVMLLAACDQIQLFTPISVPDQATETPALSSTAPAAHTPTPAASPTPEIPPAPTLEVDPSALQGRTVRFWHSWSPPLQERLNALVETFNAENEWGIQVQAVYKDNLDEAVRSAENAGALDLASAEPFQVQSWRDARELADLNTYALDPNFGFSGEEQEDFYPVFWEQGLLSGGKERFSLPALPNGAVLYYNKSWAQELGFGQPPSTIDEFREQACAANRSLYSDEDPANDALGGYILTSDYSPLLGWIAAFGGSVAPDESGYDFNTPEVESAFTFLRELYDAGCAWVLDEGHTPEGSFAVRQGLFSAGSVTGVRYQQEALTREQNEDEWTVIPFPAAESGSPGISIFGPVVVLFSSTTEQETAGWLFIKWLLSPANHAQLVQAGGSLPVRATEMALLEGSMPAAWQEAARLAPLGQNEPHLASWETVRWAVFDAGTQLFRYYFTLPQVPALVELLDETAADIHEGIDE
mgnify:FL=1